jgi:ribosomal protein S18 acetylase RimI-like enzyme
MELSAEAGWNQTPADWEMLLALSTHGCFGIEVEGRIVSTTTLLCFGQTIGWLGMVLTHPRHRRKGFARRLVQHAIETAKNLEIATLKLDATEEGRPVYEALGFRPERKIERWLLANRKASSKINSQTGLDSSSLSLDQDAYGYDRTFVLEELARRSTALETSGGFLLIRPGRVAPYIGPFISKDASLAADLLSRATEGEHGSPYYLDIFPDNAHAIALAESHGFERQRTLTRMSLTFQNRAPQQTEERTQWIYGIAGFEIG